MLRVAVPVAVLVLGLAGGLVVHENSGRGPAAASFPPAVLAGRDFTPYQQASTRGIVLSEGRVASAGAEIVAVGAESGQLVPRAQFFVSLDGGRTWNLGGVTTADGGTPPPGHAARFVAGGAGAWAAIGSDAVWTSTDGRAWTLDSATGLPRQPGDQVTVLKRTGSGFVAAGASLPGGNRSTPVLFLSADGKRWTRLGGGQLHLAAGSGRAQDIRLAAVSGNRILIAGDVATHTGQAGAAWLSEDGGRDWRAVSVPAGHGAAAEFSDMAATSNGFLLVRPATAHGRAAADVYRSGNGTDWTFAATLTTPAGFSPGLMNGGSAGAVLAGQSGSSLTAFTSADGVRWRQVPVFGRAPGEGVSGVAVTATGAVIAAGGSQPDSQRLITVGRAGEITAKVSLSAIPGGVQPQVALNAVAAMGAQGRQQVAVGSANGFPAAWTSADGGRTWNRAAGQAPSVLNRPGIQQLTSVAHGPEGWLAVGGTAGAGGITGAAGGAAGHPVVIGSADGRSWSAADGEAAFAGGGLTVAQAAAGRDGYVIVGSQRVAGPGGQARTIAAAWWSAGLTDWHRANSVGGGQQMVAVAAMADGFAAVGSDGQRPAVWTTADGRSWRMADLPLPAGATTAALEHVAAAGQTVVATGVAQTATGSVPYAARSGDGGRTWTEARLPVPAGTAQVSAVAAGRGFTVAGTFGVTAGDRDVVVWTSRNGLTWKAATPAGAGLATPGIQAITGLTVSGDTLTGVGFTATPSGEQPTIWQPPIG